MHAPASRQDRQRRHESSLLQVLLPVNRPLSHAELLGLKRWNTPTIYNGWEQITDHERTSGFVNREETHDFMPQMGPMVGYAVTGIFEPSNPKHLKKNPNAWAEYREYIAKVSGPKIVVNQDLDRPDCVGSYWGEVNANVSRTLGCVGCINDGAIRDVDEMTNAGFKALAARLCVGHAHAAPAKWGCEVEVFGRRVEPGQLVHADKHGFLAIPAGEEEHLLEASLFMDRNECETVIPAARSASGLSTEELLEQLKAGGKAFGENTQSKFSKDGEW